MFSRFTTALYNAVDALAPPLPLQEDFIWHWKSITKFYTSKNASNKTPIEVTRIPDHLTEMLTILEQEQKESELSSIGPCMEYLMQNKLLDTMCVLATSDTPPGMKQYMLMFISQFLKFTPQFLIPHVSIYVPITNFMKFCGEILAGPSEKEEIEFLEVICEKLKENPHLVNCFLGPFNIDSQKKSIYSENEEMLKPTLNEMKSLRKSSTRDSLVENTEHNLISSLLKLFCSPDNTLSVRASNCLKLCCSLSNDSSAMAIAHFTNLSQVMCKHLKSLYSCVPKTMKLSEIETTHMVLEDSCFQEVMSADKRKYLCYLKQLNLIDTLVKEAHPFISENLCNTLGIEFLNSVIHYELVSTEESDINLFVTTILSSSLRHILSSKLLSAFGIFLLGDLECFEISGHTSHLVKDLLIERCRNTKKNLPLSMATLQLFEELLLHPTTFILNNLVLSNLEGRGYYNNSILDDLCNISDDEDSVNKFQDESSLSPFSTTFAPPYIHKIIESFLSLVPEEILSCETEEESGYDTYVKEAHIRFKKCLELCEDFDWPQEPSCIEDFHYGAEDDSSSESQPEADSMCWKFYEGPFLNMIFDKIEQMLDTPYDINLQITALVSRLALFAHPNLHEYLLNPFVCHNTRSRSLFSVLRNLVDNIKEKVKGIKSFRQKLTLTRKALLGDGSDYEPFDESNVLEVLIVVEEFCKELAAIVYVKYHAAS